VTALRHGTAGDFVYVLNTDKTVTMRSVTRGQATVDKIQIVTGLKVGEQVITEGADRLKDGAKVTLPGDRPAAAGAKGERGERGERAGRRQREAGTTPAPAAPAGTTTTSAAAAAAPAAPSAPSTAPAR